MKTLTTLTAVAALIAGISIASAQTSTMDKSGTMGSSSMQRDRQRQVLHQRRRRRAELPVRQSRGLPEGRQGQRNLRAPSEQHHRVEILSCFLTV